MTQSAAGRLSALELTERGKQVVKHAEVLRSLGGRMVMRVGNVVDGRECSVEPVEEAFVEGIRRVSFDDLCRSAVMSSYTRDCSVELCRHRVEFDGQDQQ